MRILTSFSYLNAIIFILIFSSLQFFLILRHKSPYLSDSYMYKHIYYQLQGNNFEQARLKVTSQIDLSKVDNITKNIFEDQSQYADSLTFFTKRPFYPFVAFIINSLLKNEYLAFLLPVFFSYLGVITLAIYFFNLKLDHFFTILATALFISFYPLLDWSTYFLTDTIGTFFWLLQLLFIYKYLSSQKTVYIFSFLITLVVSLTNREQSLLMLPLSILIFAITKRFNYPRAQIKKSQYLILLTLLSVILFILISKLFHQKNIVETLVYTMNSYGLFDQQFTNRQILNYLFSAIITAHESFLRELITHHWWLSFTGLGVLEAFRTFYEKSKPNLVDILLLSSGAASYCAIFIYPVLSYRFFFPMLLTIIYFCSILLDNFAKRINSNV